MPLLKDLIGFYVLELTSKNVRKGWPQISRFSVIVAAFRLKLSFDAVEYDDSEIPPFVRKLRLCQ